MGSGCFHSGRKKIDGMKKHQSREKNCPLCKLSLELRHIVKECMWRSWTYKGIRQQTSFPSVSEKAEINVSVSGENMFAVSAFWLTDGSCPGFIKVFMKNWWNQWNKETERSELNKQHSREAKEKVRWMPLRVLLFLRYPQAPADTSIRTLIQLLKDTSSYTGKDRVNFSDLLLKTPKIFPFWPKENYLFQKVSKIGKKRTQEQEWCVKTLSLSQ